MRIWVKSPVLCSFVHVTTKKNDLSNNDIFICRRFMAILAKEAGVNLPKWLEDGVVTFRIKGVK